MNGLLDIKSPNWLGGNNVHNKLILLGVVSIAWNVGVLKRAYLFANLKKQATLKQGWLLYFILF